MQIVHNETGFYEPIYKEVLGDLNRLVEAAEKARVEEVFAFLEDEFYWGGDDCSDQYRRRLEEYKLKFLTTPTS